jgi:pimeloyl-ACP methyl ester carboxylesterase
VGLALAAGLVALAVWVLYTPDLPRQRLAARYPVPGEATLTLAGTPLHLAEAGSATAPAVILIHGFGDSLHAWDGWADGLAQALRVIRIDLPGAGLSPPDATGDYTDARSVALILALMDARGIARADLIGNSIGNHIVWRFAAAHPDRVRKLVLISPDGFASPGFAYDVAPAVPFWVGLLRYVLPRGIARANLALAFADPGRLDPKRVTMDWQLLRAPGARAALIARMRQTELHDPRPALATIRAPVLLLWGDKDALIPISNAQDYLAALPDARLVALPDLGHVPQEEAPEASLAPVLAFLHG